MQVSIILRLPTHSIVEGLKPFNRSLLCFGGRMDVSLADRRGRVAGNPHQAHLIHADGHARLAAFSAAVTADSLQRSGMVAWLRAMAADIQSGKMPVDSPARELSIANLQNLDAQICTKNWSMSDVLAVKRQLSKIDREYSLAIGKPDPTVFVRRHPTLACASPIST